MTRLIEDYALLGDGRTAALVGKDGSVDWLCLPRFDSGAVFAALLGDSDNGRWCIAPSNPDAQMSRAYRSNTLILETECRTSGGVARIIDFMTPRGDRAELVRIVAGDEGRVEFDLDLTMRPDYGRTMPWVRRGEDCVLTAISGPDMLVLRAPVRIDNADMRSTANFSVKAGERIRFSLTHQQSWLPLPCEIDLEAALENTETFWTGFAGHCPEVGKWTEPVRRSLITLKALIYQPTGGIVAAPTTSLPETVGGGRNWDYRYCWLRDSSLTLMAFLELGYMDEAAAWRDWLFRAIAGDPAQMQIMYGVGGERTLIEWEVDWLPGFRGSKPVRIGNAAAGQFQVDVYGEVSEILTLARRNGLEDHCDAKGISGAFLPYLSEAWRKPDDGIWEMRGERQHYVHSKIMAWVAFDRQARLLADNGGDDDDCARWRSIAAEIHEDVCTKGYDEELGSFVQSYGSKTVDASLLHVALTGFLPPDDPRVAGTVKAIEERLSRDGFVARYDTANGTDGVSDAAEGAFLICTFWLVDTLVLLGRRDEAEALFEKAIALCNDVGLLAEQFDPVEGILLGNFPQAFSHVGLILSALNLARENGPVRKRAAEAQDRQRREPRGRS